MDGSAPSRCRPPATTSELEIGGRGGGEWGVRGGWLASHTVGELFEHSVQSM